MRSSSPQAAEKTLETFLQLQTLFLRAIKLTKQDTVLWAIHKGTNTPAALTRELDVAKGNLANYCKTLISDRLLVRCRPVSKKTIYYELTNEGRDKIKKLLNTIEEKTKQTL